jgi:hypothetical protein
MRSADQLLAQVQRLAMQNCEIDVGLDSIVESAFTSHQNVRRQDWPELRRTIEAFLNSALTFAEPNEHGVPCDEPSAEKNAMESGG